MRRTSSIIPCKKDNLSVYNIRKVCFASLLSFLKKLESPTESISAITCTDNWEHFGLSNAGEIGKTCDETMNC